MNGLRLVDTHAHLGDEAFDGDRTEVLRRARDAGVKAVITVGETLDDARTNLALAELHPEILPTAGLYPTHLDGAAAGRLIEWTLEHHERLIAIGEVGLDHWKVEGDEARALQHEIFSRFIDLSKQTDLPLNVHSRSAGRAAIELLLERGATRVQLHAFDGRAAKALAGVEAGFFFSIPPCVVRSPQKQKLVRRLPLENLLVETDSPVLGPVAGQRNEPANVAISVAAIAELKELAEEHVVEAVVENQYRLYRV
ncbi:MAG: TatD family hydrolase [Acidobacteriota bacterium]|nr:TatD family hydrolase [Acidobacteriota bacterium]